MIFTRTLRNAVLTLAFIACTGIVASAQTDTDTLDMSANVVSSVQIVIGGAAVVEGGINFGDVDAFGTESANVNVSTTANPDGTGALYRAPITLTTNYAGFASETATISVIATGTDADLIREGPDGGTLVNVEAADDILTLVANTDVDNREVGFQIAQTTVAGSKSAVLTYTVTVD